MKQSVFVSQLKEDITVIQKQWGDEDPKLSQIGYAFNYWILNYLYHIDIENCIEYITEYKDKGIDCFVHYEDTKELYIIQNSYCESNTSVRREHFSDFLLSPLTALTENSFTRSIELQNIYNSIKDDNDYTVYLYYYITKPKNSISPDVQKLFNNSNYSLYNFEVAPRLIALEDIINIYNGNRFIEKINFKFTITLQKRNMIDIKSEQHDKNKNVNTAYFAINVFELYKMFIASEQIGYDLFDDNIREYLGLKGKRGKINKDIFNTLIDDEERSRFFYYNNGITMICNKYISPTKSKRDFTIIQPKIVNGCQTMNTITSAIESFLNKGEAQKDIINNFKHCTVLVKVYEVNKEDEYENHIYKNIVKNTNSQTSISSRDFASKNSFFLTLQEDFLKRGFYLIVRQSDQYTYDKDDLLFQKTKNLH